MLRNMSETSKEKQRKYFVGDLNGNPIKYKKEEHCGVLDDDGKKFQILHLYTHKILIIGEECPFSLYKIVWVTWRLNNKALCGHTEEQRRCADPERNYEEIVENLKERIRIMKRKSQKKRYYKMKLERGTATRRPTKGDPAVIRAKKVKLDICMDKFKVI